MFKKDGADLNLLLQAASLCGLLAAWAGLAVYGPNAYAGLKTVALGTLLYAETLLLLRLELRRRNPLLLLFLLNATIFYCWRVTTLVFSPKAVVFTYNGAAASDVNSGLLFLLAANLAIAAGLWRPGGAEGGEPAAPRGAEFGPALALAAVWASAGYSALSYFAAPHFPRLEGYAGIIFNHDLLFLAAGCALLLSREKPGGRQIAAMLAALVIFVFFRTLGGSRSGIFSVFTGVVIALLAARPEPRIPFKVLKGLAVAAPLSVILFFAGSYLRWTHAHYGRIFVMDDRLYGFLSLAPVVDRVGFLSSSVDLIANAEKYAEVINLPYYCKSIVDNNLTPGFSVFDAPRVATMLRHIYYKEPRPGLEQVRARYHSDMLTAYGEFYVLAGKYLALPLLALFAFLFRLAYRGGAAWGPLPLAVYRGSVLLLFFGWLNSYGLDWLAIDLTRTAITLLAFYAAFRALGAARPGAAAADGGDRL